MYLGRMHKICIYLSTLSLCFHGWSSLYNFGLWMKAAAFVQKPKVHKMYIPDSLKICDITRMQC